MALTLTSPAFKHDEKIPAKYTCDGDRALSPPLAWSGAPEGTKSFVLIMDDPDIPEIFKQSRGIEAFDHWVLYNIPPQARGISVGWTTGTPGTNSAGATRDTGPCPPPEYEPRKHRYIFTLYALHDVLHFDSPPTKQQVLAVLTPFLIAKTELVGRYARK